MSQKDLTPRDFCFEHNSLENKYFTLSFGWDIDDQHRRNQTKFRLILIIIGNVIDVQMSKSKFSVCAGYLAMGNGLFCVLHKTKQQNNEQTYQINNRGQKVII